LANPWIRSNSQQLKKATGYVSNRLVPSIIAQVM
jgi:hypothetical protein